jgi:hypothetical protein
MSLAYDRNLTEKLNHPKVATMNTGLKKKRAEVVTQQTDPRPQTTGQTDLWFTRSKGAELAKLLRLLPKMAQAKTRKENFQRCKHGFFLRRPKVRPRVSETDPEPQLDQIFKNFPFFF